MKPSKQLSQYLNLLILIITFVLVSLKSFSQFSETEPNNTFSTANYISFGVLQSGMVQSTTDAKDPIDCFVTTLPASGTLTIYVNATNTGTKYSYLEVTTYNGNNQGTSSDNYIGADAGSTSSYAITIYGVAFTTFYIVPQTSGSFIYSFNYSISNISQNDFEPNDDFADALSLNTNVSKSGHVGYLSYFSLVAVGYPPQDRDDNDYYKIVSPINGSLKIKLKIKCVEGHSQLDDGGAKPSMNVYNAEGYRLAKTIDKVLPFNSTISDTLSITCHVNDTFYISVGATGASDYQISASFSNLPLSVSVVNPNPSLITSNGTIETDFVLPDSLPTVTAAVTDGITKLLLVTNASFPLTFSLDNNDGSLSSLFDQKTLSKQLTIAPDDRGKVIVIYTVPEGYGTTSPVNDRSVNITIADASNSSNYTTSSIKLITPPLVMVHGMWSDPSIWDKGGFTTFLAGSGITNVYLADYSQASATTFDPYNFASYPPRMEVQVQIDKALKDYQDKNIAVTQVDIVGHSLGGLMTRSLSQQSSFLEQRNYYQGFVHKLITLGTPHRGSPFGPELYKYKDSLVYYHIDGVAVSAPYPLSYILQLAGMPIGSCHKDFGITSQGISDLSTTLPYRTFAITADHEGNGIIPGDLTGYPAMEALCLFAFHKPFEEVMKSRCSTGGVLPNDLIVPYKSQTGYINSTQAFNGTCHSIPGLVTETNNPLIQAKVTELLLSDDTTEFSVGFPAPSSFPLESCDNTSELIGDNQSIKKREASNNIAGNPQPTGKEYVQLSAPARGSVYHQNVDTVITVGYEPLGGSIPTNALLAIQNVGWYQLPTTPPYSTNITLPKNVKTGSLTMVLMVTDTTGISLVDTSHVTFLPSGILNKITIQPTSLLFDSLNRQIKMLIQEEYAGIYGTYLSDISSMADGIIYATKKGNSIITVAADGTITAVSAGIDTLTVQVGDSTFKVPIVVDINFLSREVYPNVIDFADIPDKVVNDAPFALDATTTSGNNVNFTVIGGPAEITNGVVYIQGSGVVTVQATSAGNVYFDSAAPVTKTFYVTGVLPLQLLSFTGSVVNNEVLLNWTIANEVNTSYFTIERSADGIHFTDIGTLNAAGNSLDMSNYYFKDRSTQFLSVSPVYYRLKEVDEDGKQTLSNTIPITLNNIKKIIIYPNPAKRIITLLLNQALESDSYLKLYDMTGKEVLNQKLTSGLSQQIFLPLISNGNYKIVIWSHGKIVHQQMLFVAEVI